MFLLETNIGNFSDYRSLYLEMKNLGLEAVEVVGKYRDSRFPKMELTILEVKDLMEVK
jgi:hypothetical protein